MPLTRCVAEARPLSQAVVGKTKAAREPRGKKKHNINTKIKSHFFIFLFYNFLFLGGNQAFLARSGSCHPGFGKTSPGRDKFADDHIFFQRSEERRGGEEGR